MAGGKLLDRRRGAARSEPPGTPDSSPLPDNRNEGSAKDHKPSAAASKSALFSRNSLMILMVGILTGYVVLPIILIEANIDEYKGRLGFSGSGSLRNPSGERALGKEDAEARLIEDQELLSTQSLPTLTTPYVMKTHFLSDHKRKKILVTGGAGFVGSHLVDKLMMEGHEVIVADNFFTGQKKNIAHWLQHPNFR
jgi:hypothetical protein